VGLAFYWQPFRLATVMPQRISLPFQCAFADEGLQPRRHLGNLYSMQNREDDHQLPSLAVGDGFVVRWQAG
jgi:hypothetical protein